MDTSFLGNIANLAKVFGPLAAVLIVVCIGQGFLIRALWREKLKRDDAYPALIERIVTALNQSTSAMERSAAEKEANTAALATLTTASERHSSSCDRVTESVDRLALEVARRR